MTAKAHNMLGQKMGRKGRETRQKIMDATIELLKTSSYKDLSVSEIAVEAGLSNATFYVYFKDVEEVIYACLQSAALDHGELFEVLDAEWNSENLREKVSRFVGIYNELWNKYRIELRIRNLEADQGNLRFLNLKIESNRAMLDKLGQKIALLNPDLKYPHQIASVIHAAMGALAAQHDINISSTARQTRKKMNAAVVEMICTVLQPG